MNIRTRFRIIYTNNNNPKKKPAPKPLLTIAKKLKIDPNNLVMIKNNSQNIECTQNTDYHIIDVENTYSPHKKLITTKPNIILENLSDVTKIIKH